MLQKINIMAIVVTIKLASPFPDAPMYLDNTMTIAKFKMAMSTLIMNVEAIFFNIYTTLFKHLV